MKRKFFKLSDLSVSETGTISGYASRSGNVDLSKEVVARGAFAKTLQENPTTVVLWQHRPEEPIGVSTSLIEDGKGLRITAQLNLETQRGREAYALLKQGAIKGLSIGYDVLRDKVEKGVRYLTELKLWEFSVVTFPCNQAASVDSIKSLAASGNKFADTFAEMNEEAQLRSGKYTMLDVLSSCLSTAVCDYSAMIPATDEEAMAYASDSLDEFKAAALVWIAAYRAFNAADMAEDAAGVQKSLALRNHDTPVLSQKREEAQHHLDALKALLAAPQDVLEPVAVKDHSEAADAGTRAAGPDHPSDASPSALDALIASVKAATHSPARI